MQMLKNRKHNRFTRRLETEFKVGERVIRGISSNLSKCGLFIRTNTPLIVGSYVDATIFLHDGRRSRISGIVRSATRSNLNTLVKNGMGIELVECDDNFMEILRELGEDITEAPCNLASAPANSKDNSGTSAQTSPSMPEFLIISCSGCGAKNRVRAGFLDKMTPKCGRCKAPLTIP